MSLWIPNSKYTVVYRLENPRTWDLHKARADALELKPTETDPAVYIESYAFDPVAPFTLLGLPFPQLGTEAQVKVILRMRGARLEEEARRAVRINLEAQGIGPLTYLWSADITTAADRAGISPGAVFLEETFGPLVEGVEDIGESIVEGVTGTFKLLPLIVVGAVGFMIWLKS